ncbi:MAG: phycobiliprotein lyase [Thermosynechococcaceae cyanobacterium]
MNISEFVSSSIGCWKSQRSVHHLAFGHFEAVQSEVNIVPLSVDESSVISLCHTYNVDPQLAASPFQISWEGQSDWDDNESSSGTTILVPVPDPQQGNCGRLLRDQGYAEKTAAVGDYYFTEEGTFVLETPYDRAAAEEKIWFINPNVRFRVALIKTSAGTGVVTASFASEIKQE